MGKRVASYFSLDEDYPPGHVPVGTVRRISLTVLILCSRAFLQFWKDIKAIQWRRLIAWAPLIAWICCLVVAIVFISIPNTSSNYVQFAQCPTAKSFSLSGDVTNVWQDTDLFDINIAFGNFTFGWAKTLDVCWDLGVGRGGQAILSLFAYRVLTQFLTAYVFLNPLSFSAYKHLFIVGEPSFKSLLELLKDSFLGKLRLPKAAKIWIIISTAFLVAAPTLVAAMSAYDVTSDPYINKIPVTSNGFSLAHLVIHDASRMDLEDDFNILSSWDSKTKAYSNCTEAFDRYSLNYCNFTIPSRFISNPTYDVNNCLLWSCTLQYLAQYGFYGLSDKNSTFLGRNFKPALNISAHYLDPKMYPNSQVWQNLTTWTDPRTGAQPFVHQSQTTYFNMMTKTTYTDEFLKANGRCIASGRYQYGFAFPQLFAFLIMLLLWTCGTYTMWLKAHFILRSRPDLVVHGRFGAIMVLSAAIQERIDNAKLAGMSEQDLQREIDGNLGGGTVPLCYPMAWKPTGLRKRFKSWAGEWVRKRENQCWAFLFFVSVVLSIFLSVVGNLGAGIVLAVGVAFVIIAQMVCSTLGSRVVMVALGYLLFTLIISLVGSF